MPEYKSIRTKGVLEDRVGYNSGRFRVLAFKRQGQFIYDPEEIRKEFPPNGFVFAPGVFNIPKYTEDTIWEFFAIAAENVISGGDIMLLDNNRDSTKLDFQVFDIYEEVMVTEKQFNQPLLNRYFRDATSKFYIHQKENLYGPFKTINGEVVPETRRHVNLYGRIPRIHEIDQRRYLLELPSDNNIIEKIECYTRSQLADWFKREVKVSGLKIDWNEWESLLETWDDSGEGLGRFNQISIFMNELRISQQEIRKLASSSLELQNMYQQSINEIRDVLRDQELDPIIQKKELLEKEISILNQTIDNLRNENETLNSQKKIHQEEHNFIKHEKERLINDIRIHSTVEKSNDICSIRNVTREEKMQTFEIQLFQKSGNVYLDLKSFAKECQTMFDSDAHIRKEGILSFFLLKEYKAILCNQPDWVLQFARLSNNCKLFIQQVEVDWLKYEHLFKNGLRQCWESAVENPELIHVLLLEDINLASLECYGRPLLDLLSNRRKTLPGLSEPWPKNLWIFGVPLELDKLDNFGLPLIRNTYKHWGAIYPFSNIYNAQEASDTKYLPVDVLYDHEIKSSLNLDSYFT